MKPMLPGRFQEVLDKPALRERADGELLSRFLAAHEEAAFAVLVERYQPMVLRVCLHVLHQRQDAEAASQATFLVLLRKAASIRKGEAVGSWLHRAAYHEARNVRKRRRRRQDHERTCENCELAQLAQSADETEFQELQTLVNAEVRHLAEKYRAPFVLCCLEGKSKAEAARQLGWKEGTVSSRLAKARKLVQRGLIRRGVVPPTK